jgi:hypothetical protein
LDSVWFLDNASLIGVTSTISLPPKFKDFKEVFLAKDGEMGARDAMPPATLTLPNQ